MSSSAKRRVEVWAFKGQEDNSQEDGRGQLLVTICHAMQIDLSDIKSYLCYEVASWYRPPSLNYFRQCKGGRVCLLPFKVFLPA